MTADNMVERVARAILNTYRPQSGPLNDLSGLESVTIAVQQQQALDWSNAMVAARAAIAALREPTEEMASRGGEIVCVIDLEFSAPDSASRQVWCAMIDSALAEGS